MRGPMFSAGMAIMASLVAVCLLPVPLLLSAEEIPASEQLSNQDLQSIIALLGAEKRAEKNLAAAGSDPVPAIVAPSGGSSAGSTGGDASAALNPAINQDELAQSLALLNTLFASGGQSATDLSALLGAATPAPTVATTTTTSTTTTQNPLANEAAAAQLLTALLGAAGTGSSSSSDASGLAALLSLAGAGAAQQKQEEPKQGSNADAQNAALLTNLLLSASQSSGQGSGIKQQDFQNFQNAGGGLDPSSSNQLTGALNLLGTLGSLGSLGGGGGNLQPNLFNLGGQQSAGGGLLGGLLGGGGRQPGLLGLLAPQQQQQQAPRPGLLSSLGTLATVVGSTLSGVRNNLGVGPPKLRGVDTRLGLGYRFGENADAQVLWEIGPQLFTEPLTDEQKQQLRLQQEQLRLQQQQLELQLQKQKNPNRRLWVDRRKTMMRPSPLTFKSNSLVRRHLPVASPQQARRTLVSPVMEQPPQLPQHSRSPTPKLLQSQQPSTLQQLLQPPPAYYRQSPRRTAGMSNIGSESGKMNQLNYYAKAEANPRSNTNSQLTEYERWLLHSNPHRDQIHQQQYLVNTNHGPAPAARKDAFTFTKDASRNIVRVRVQPRESPRQVQVVQSVGNVPSRGSQHHGMELNQLGFSRRTSPFNGQNPGADDSYYRRNAAVTNPSLREYQLEQERQRQQVLEVQRLQRQQERQQQILNAQRRQKQKEKLKSVLRLGNRPPLTANNGQSSISSMPVASNVQPLVPGMPVPLIAKPGQQPVAAQTSMATNIQPLVSGMPVPLIATPGKHPAAAQPPQTKKNQRIQPQQNRKMTPAQSKTLAEWSEKTSLTDMVSNYVINRLRKPGNNVVKNLLPDKGTADGKTFVDLADLDESKPGFGISAVLKGYLGIGEEDPPPQPIIKLGENVAYDDLRTILSGGHFPGPQIQKIPTLSDSDEIHAEEEAKERFPSPKPEIFIDIASGEVSIRKAFGTMESFTPPPPEYIPEDHPKHVLGVLKLQLAKEYEKIKLEQLKKAAEQVRKDNLAHGLSNPKDPLYLAASMFDLVEKES